MPANERLLVRGRTLTPHPQHGWGVRVLGVMGWVVCDEE